MFIQSILNWIQSRTNTMYLALVQSLKITMWKNNDLEAAKKVFFNKKNDGKTVSSGLQSNIDKLVKKNIIHKNNGDRKKSKYAGMLKKLETSLQS